MGFNHWRGGGDWTEMESNCAGRFYGAKEWEPPGDDLVIASSGTGIEGGKEKNEDAHPRGKVSNLRHRPKKK